MMLMPCGVQFNEELHTYTYNGTEYSGITSIIKKYLFPDMYSNVSESILNAARERGSIVHSELEMEFNGIPSNSAEVIAYRKIANDNNFKQIGAEYLVCDYLTNVATMIDSVLQLGSNEVALVDYKTTATLNIEYLRWQLSIEKFLFECCNANINVTKLYAIHLPKPKDGVCEGKLVEIQPIPTEHVTALLNAHRDGAETFVNPLTQMGDEFDELLEQYRLAQGALLDMKESIDYYEGIQKEIKEKIRAIMDERGCSQVENDDIRVTRSADQVRKTFDIQLLQEQSPKFPAKWIKEIESKGYKESVTKGRLTITIK